MVAMKKITRFIFVVLMMGVLLVPFNNATANNLTFFQSFLSTDVVSAGVGGLRNQTSGVIVLGGVSGTITKAYLYWHGPTNSNLPNVNASILLNGNAVTGTNIGLSHDNCWLFANSQAYRADVTSLVTGNGNYSLTGFGSAANDVIGGANTNGASLIVFFDDGDPTNNRDVYLFDGNDSNFTNSFDPDGWQATLSGINYASGTASLQLHVADGQTLTDDALTLNSVQLVPGGAVFQGDSVPSANNGPANNGSLWDIKNFDVTSFLIAGSNTLSLTTGVVQDCVGLVVAAVDVPSIDTDRDGILNVADNCPLIYNPDQADKDLDGVGNVCDICPIDANNLCAGDYAETVTPPPAGQPGSFSNPAHPGQPVVVTAKFKNTSGADIFTPIPDCINTNFELTNDSGILPPRYRHRAYGFPNDFTTIPNGAEFLVTCDLSDMFDSSILVLGQQVQATYSNDIQDRDIVGGGCTNAPCFDAWIGSETSDPIQVFFTEENPVSRVDIDIKPGDFPNTWTCSNLNGALPVGLLSSASFDATTIDVNTVRFGKTGTEAKEIHRDKNGNAQRHTPADLNGDGRLDMIFHFRFGDTGFGCNNIPAGTASFILPGILTGTANGVAVTDSDNLQLVR
jgi:Thrombospondin type 3 repeat